MGLTLFFFAIILVYIYAGLRMINNWIEFSPGPGNWLDQDRIFIFFVKIGYDENFRTIFILIIVGVFLLSLFSMLIHNKFVKKKDAQDSTKIVVIHDDIIHVNPDKDENGNEVYHPEAFVKKDGYYTMEELYTRKGIWKIIIIIANYLTIAAILGILWTFYRTSAIAFEAVYDPSYLSTDEAYILITSCVTYLLIYYLIRCPDFVKSLAATGFKRIYVRKAHLHETFIGILLTIGGILFVLHGAGEGALGFLERATGLFILILGVYMIGRDWKDFVMGKFLRD
jgi:flagellar basal body-associated protein FliL